MATYDMYKRDGGETKKIDPKFRTGSETRLILRGYQRSPGVTKKFYERVQIVMPAHTRSYTGPNYSIWFGSGLSDFTYIQGSTGGNGSSAGLQWMDPIDYGSSAAELTQAAAFEMRYRLTSGSGPNGSFVANTWYPLYNTGENPVFEWNGPLGNTPFTRGFFDWRRMSDGVVIHSSAFNLN